MESIPYFTIFIVMKESINKGFLSSSELVRAAGVSTDTLRHYERKGVLAKPPRLRNGYRECPFEALARVRLVRRALVLGFTLGELARIFDVRDKGGVPCREVHSLAAKKLADVEAQIQELFLVRDELRTTITRWDSLLAEKTAAKRAGLLEALAPVESPLNEILSAPTWRRRKNKKHTIEEKKHNEKQ